MTSPGWVGGADELDPDPRARGDHFVVVGSNALALRLVEELTKQYRIPVVAIVRDGSRGQTHGIVELLGGAGVIVSGTVIGKFALRAAGIEDARGIAIVEDDDRNKLTVAVLAHSLNPDIRIVLDVDMHFFGEGVGDAGWDSVRLSSSRIAASAFVNAALGRPDSVNVGGRSVVVAEGDDHASGVYIGTVADRIDAGDPERMRLLPVALLGDPQPAWMRRNDGVPEPREPLGAPRTRADLRFEDEASGTPWQSRTLRELLIALRRFFTATHTRMLLAVAGVVALAGFLVIVS